MITLEEITGGETKNIEFKESLPPKSLHYLKTVVAFANTLGGKIIIGVEDRTHKIVGVPNETIFETMDSITNAISDACTPAILPDVEIQTVEGKNLIVIDVPMGRNRPYYIKSLGMMDGTFIRVSGTSRQPGEARLKDLMFEGAGRTCIRNHALARALSYMNLIENWGSGIRKITDACRDVGLREPEFLDMESSVRVNIYRKDGGLKANEDGQRIEETAQKTDNVVESTPQVTKDTPQVTENTPQVTENTPQVRMQSLHGKSSFQDERIIAFLKCFQDVPLKASELRQRMNLSDRKSFNDKYIKPCLERKWIEMTIPDKPNSQNQAYRITQRGRDVLEGGLRG